MTYKNEIKVAERDDMTYTVIKNTWSFDESMRGRYLAEVHFDGRGVRRSETWTVGNEKGYKTERGALSAIKKDAAKLESRYGKTYTLMF